MVKNLRISVTPAASEQFGCALEQALEHFKKKIAHRSPVAFPEEGGDAVLVIDYDKNVREEGFRLGGCAGRRELSAAAVQGVLAGLGKFLRTSRYTEAGMILSDWEGTSVPTSRMRGIQMDTHFCNFYHMAPQSELEEYVADLAFWGVNYFDVVFPIIDLNGWDDPELVHITGKIKAIFGEAKRLGLKVGVEIVPNQDFVIRREEYAAAPNQEPVRRRGNNGHNMCPNIPGALEYMTDLYTRMVKFLADEGALMDFLCFWPYDEGGCGCEKCRPWGANGYLKACRSIYESTKQLNPAMEIILSTWLFDCHQNDGEWEGLDAAMRRDHSWVDYILADSHTDFPRYPLEHGTIGGVPVVNYPEISMWGLFPWGGYGANPLPRRFERLWNQVKSIAKGGICYSEGCFDDLNKVVCTQFYWDAEATADAAVREYLAYEISPAAVDTLLEAIYTVERHHNETVVDNSRAITREANVLSVTPEICARAAEILEKTDALKASLPASVTESWRFRMLYDRIKLDKLRYELAWAKRDSLTDRSAWFHALQGSEEAAEVLRDVVAISHNPLRYDDVNHPMFCVVRPPLREVEGTAPDGTKYM